MLTWDVANGISRRCWAGNSLAKEAVQRAMKKIKRLRVTIPEAVDMKKLIKE